MAQEAVNYSSTLEGVDAATRQNLEQRVQLIVDRDRLAEARIALAEHAAHHQQASDNAFIE